MSENPPAQPWRAASLWRRWTLAVAGLAVATAYLCLGLLFPAGHAAFNVLDFTPTAYVYLPLLRRDPTPTPYVCPVNSSNVYAWGWAIQYDLDNPVRFARDHADKNIELRGYTPNTDPNLRRELVNYGSDDPKQPPQFATFFSPYRVPNLVNFYRVYNWVWAPSPDPGTRGTPITSYRVTALGLATVPGEPLHVPISGYDIGGGMEVLVLFADEDTVALRYTREDSSGSQGYTVHVDNICTDPNLLDLYNQLDDPKGPRYVFRYRGYCCYDLPTLPAGAVIGTARSTEIVVAISDTGSFMDPRSCNEWWQIRPGYSGTCPPHD